ncbi:MAG: hypothetical protein WC996_09535 [Peptostreptococcales bacterium]
MYITENEARAHNLVMRLFKEYTIDELKEGLSTNQLSQDIYFRESDYNNAVDEAGILKFEQGLFKGTKELFDQIAGLSAHKRADKDIHETIDIFKKKFKDLFDSEANRATRELVRLANKIHWNILPEYEEYMIVNSELLPNIDTEKYYNHFHTLEDLYRELNHEGKNVKSKKGDLNLYKKIGVEIYSRRWDHNDVYFIERTVKGWRVTFRETREGGKEGEALTISLRHDLINYPHSLRNFMLNLWKKADAQEVSVEELKKDLDQIAHWISICEKNTPVDIEV